MPAALESNIWKYAVLLVTNKRVFVAILGAYYLTIPGMNTFWIGIFLLAGNGAKLIFDIPSSYIADIIGHREALIASRLCMIGASVVFLSFASIGWFVVASVLISMGFAFASGVGSAFMHETMRALGREGDYRAVMGKISSIGFAVPAVIAALVPFLVSISYKLPFVVAIVLDCIGLVVALKLVRPPVIADKISKAPSASYLEVVRQGMALRFFRIALFSGLVSALLDGIDGFRSPYQVYLGLPVVLFGLFLGTGRLLASLMLAYSGRLHRIIGDVYSYQRLQIVIYGSLLILIACSSNPWVAVIVLLLDNGLQYGLGQIDTGYLLDIIRDSRFKATLLSTSNQIESLLSMVVVVSMGYAIEVFGYQHSFAVLAGLFFLVVAPLHLWIYRNRNYAT
jgi:MFS family permease